MLHSRRPAFWGLVVALASCVSAPSAARAGYEPDGCLSAAEAEFAELVNEYRSDHGRKRLPLSRALTNVAQWHTVDAAYAQDVSGKWGSDPECNLHSWYGVPGTKFGRCCYTPDHARAPCMWEKPAELSRGRYAAAGFENAAYGYPSPRAALEAFKTSPAHEDVILNRNAWAGLPFEAMGVGVDPVHKTYFLWFGQEPDPAGAPRSCSAVPCPARPARSCRSSFEEASLSIDETQRGNEKLVAKWLGGPSIRGNHYGDPRKRGGTEYAICVYDDRDELAAEYRVAAAGERCSGTSCWKRLGKTPKHPAHKGYSYLDRRSRRDGIRYLRLKAGAPGNSRAVVRGVNNARLDRRDLPTGVARALRGAKRATIQLHASDEPLCLSARLGRVDASTTKRFHARK